MQQSDQHNKKYKSMFFDLDGTLLGSSRVLHPDTRRELARAKERGDRIYLCSGRPPVYLLNDICRVFPFDGMVACAGGVVYVGEEKIWENRIPPEVFEETCRLLGECGAAMQFDTAEGTYFTRECMAGFGKILEDAGIFPAGMEEKMARENEELERLGINRLMSSWTEDIPVQKIVFTAVDRSGLDRNMDRFKKHFAVNPFFQTPKGIAGELIPLDCTKEHGIRKVLEYTGASWEGTAGFGDSLNDLEMLQAVRIKVAAVYAPEEVRAAADYLFEDPDQGGLARVLRKIEEDETVDRT